MHTQKDKIIKHVLLALSDTLAAIEQCRMADMALAEALLAFSWELQALLAGECAVDGENQGKDN